MKGLLLMMLFALVAACHDPVETFVVEDLSADGYQDVRATFRPLRAGEYRIFIFFRSKDPPSPTTAPFTIAGTFDILGEGGAVLTSGEIVHQMSDATTASS